MLKLCLSYGHFAEGKANKSVIASQGITLLSHIHSMQFSKQRKVITGRAVQYLEVWRYLYNIPLRF